MENKDSEAMLEEIADEAFIEERPDDEAMIEEVSDEVFIEERKSQPHAIHIIQPEHGRLVAYPPYAIAGENISINCNNDKPNEYEIKGINVITSNGVWRLGNQRSFQMPDSEVTLEAVFEKITKNTKTPIFLVLCAIAFIIVLILLFNSSSSQSHVSSEPEYVVPAEPMGTENNTAVQDYNQAQVVPAEPMGTGNNSVIDNYSDEGSDTNQPTATKITINGDDVSVAYSSGGNFIVITDNNTYLDTSNQANRIFGITNRYTQLNIENAFEVYVSDTASRITISSNGNAMPEVVEAEGGNELIIRNKSTNINELSQVSIPYNPNLTNIRISGASTFNSNHTLKGQNIKIDISGSSNLNCNIEANELDLHMGQASHANLSGRVGTIKLNLDGASSLTSRIAGNGYTLACDKCNGSMSGSSNASVHCDSNINVSLTGASNLHYSGNAVISGSSTSGVSKITHY